MIGRPISYINKILLSKFIHYWLKDAHEKISQSGAIGWLAIVKPFYFPFFIIEIVEKIKINIFQGSFFASVDILLL